MLDCVAPDWPVEARTAQVRLWFKLDHTKPSKEEVIGEVETKPGELRDFYLPEAPHVRFGVHAEETPDGCVLTVDEEHPLNTPRFDWVRVQIRNAPADEIRRIYNHKGRFASHVFVFLGRSLPQILNDRLQFTTRGDLQAGAAAITEPLRVTIHR